MPTVTALKEIYTEYKEKKQFTPGILWVSAVPLREDLVQEFAQAARARVKVVETTQQAVVEWKEGNYVGLIVGHIFDIGSRGYHVLNSVIQSTEGDMPPIAVGVVTSGVIYERDAFAYDRLGAYGECRFQKDEGYAAIGERFRGILEQMMGADGLLPIQQAHLQNLSNSPNIE